jgi:hypothetical protein
MVLRFFLLLVEAAVFFFADAFLADAFFAGARLAGAVFFSAGVLADEAGGWDWAAAVGTKPMQSGPSPSRKKTPVKTATAKRRTQTLPTAESWHP